MIKPLNKHVEVKPIPREGFIVSLKDSYEEIGTVLSVADDVSSVQVGDVVYFDSWLCAKYPNGDEFYWLVPESALRAKECNG